MMRGLKGSILACKYSCLRHPGTMRGASILQAVLIAVGL